MSSYERYFSGELENYDYPADAVAGLGGCDTRLALTGKEIERQLEQQGRTRPRRQPGGRSGSASDG